ncbi:SDH family Clp fold serine proteinase [Flexistipes sp.]|uniref:SDH family Clp fold serine proteinase n=1 Tax=Flexistipes sp. TaxID=3088135 RepID=UPI002E1C56FC|nr:hypothetical protein [Flexistipes sp.]
MPTLDELQVNFSKIPEMEYLFNALEDLAKQRESSVILYSSGFTEIKRAPSIFFSITDKDTQGFMTCLNGINKKKLDLIIHTPGGDYEATKRIISYLDNSFSEINVFVPHLAMSGGSLIACSSDKIYMGNYSNIGPTDPQIYISDKGFVGVNSMLQEFDKAVEDVKKEPETSLIWNERLKQIPFGLINSAEIMEKNSKQYLVDILSKRLCKNSDKESIGRLADFLNSNKHHSSHGSGINLETAKEKGLNVEDLGKDKLLEDKVLTIYHTMSLIYQKTPITKIIANSTRKNFLNTFSE